MSLWNLVKNKRMKIRQIIKILCRFAGIFSDSESEVRGFWKTVMYFHFPRLNNSVYNISSLVCSKTTKFHRLFRMSLILYMFRPALAIFRFKAMCKIHKGWYNIQS
jgi:hypothetical protein